MRSSNGLTKFGFPIRVLLLSNPNKVGRDKIGKNVPWKRKRNAEREREKLG